MDENELWILSFYRTSEISGSLFFGRLARNMRPGPIQMDLTKHFADEARHAWLWSECIGELGGRPIRLNESYQDQYISAAGMPVNVMEVLAITQVFEKRVINQYARHSLVPDLHSRIKETFDEIMRDEKWHIEWVRDALKLLEPEYGKEDIEATLKRFREADEEVYRKTMDEHSERMDSLTRRGIKRTK